MKIATPTMSLEQTVTRVIELHRLTTISRLELGYLLGSIKYDLLKSIRTPWNQFVQTKLPMGVRSADICIKAFEVALNKGLVSIEQDGKISKQIDTLPSMTELAKPDIAKVAVTKSTRQFSMTIRSRVYAEANGVCVECNQFANWDYYECDHIVPYSKGGATDYDNAQCLCKACNRTKGAS